MLPPVTRMRVLKPYDNGCLDTQTQGDSRVPTKRRINHQQGQQNCNTAKGKKIALLWHQISHAEPEKNQLSSQTQLMLCRFEVASALLPGFIYFFDIIHIYPG